MKKILIGTVLGIAAGYTIFRLKKEGKLDGIRHSLHVFSSKAKRDLKNAVDTGKNQLEYVKDRVEYEIKNGTEKLS